MTETEVSREADDESRDEVVGARREQTAVKVDRTVRRLTVSLIDVTEGTVALGELSEIVVTTLSPLSVMIKDSNEPKNQ